jgi:hypothetical protein
MPHKHEQIHIIGWREWVGLPQLGIEAVKAKIDTGATTSAIHAIHVERFRRRGRDFVRFQVHPLQKETHLTVSAEAPLLDFRNVRSSSGHETPRPVIRTQVELFEDCWPIELTLANRDQMGFRMLLGRQAIRDRFLVDAGTSYRDSSRVPDKRRH